MFDIDYRKIQIFFFIFFFSIQIDYELLDLGKIKSFPNIFKSSSNEKLKQNPKQLILSFKLFNRNVELDLELNDQLFAPNFMYKNLRSKDLNCFYHGELREAIDHSKSSKASVKKTKQIKRTNLRSSKQFKNIVSLSNCNGLRGFIQSKEHLYLINQLNEQLIRRFNLHNRIKLNNNTLLIKRTKNKDLINELAKRLMNKAIDEKILNAQNLDELYNDELYNVNATRTMKNRHRIPYDLKRSKRSTDRSDFYRNPKIELAVFGDESLYNYLKNTHFIQTDHQIVTFILTILNGIQSLYNQFNKYDINIKFNIVLLEIFRKQPKVCSNFKKNFFCSY